MSACLLEKHCSRTSCHYPMPGLSTPSHPMGCAPSVVSVVDRRHLSILGVIYNCVCVALDEAHFLHIVVGVGATADYVFESVSLHHLLEDFIQFLLRGGVSDVLEYGCTGESVEYLVGQSSCISISLPSMAS